MSIVSSMAGGMGVPSQDWQDKGKLVTYMGVLWLILTGIRCRIAQKYTPPPPSSVWGMPGHKWHIHARP